MGDDFVTSYIKVAEGEKDPRNLMMGFSIMRVILIEFDPYLHLEVSMPELVSCTCSDVPPKDLFDIVFCYFPITFRPPPNDPYGITSDDLKLALRYVQPFSTSILLLTHTSFEENAWQPPLDSRRWRCQSFSRS